MSFVLFDTFRELSLFQLQLSSVKLLKLLTSSEVSWLLLQMSVVNPVQPETLSEVNEQLLHLRPEKFGLLLILSVFSALRPDTSNVPPLSLLSLQYIVCSVVGRLVNDVI